MTDLKILATGLGAGILIDAVVIRCLLVPAMVALFGRANWWMPGRLATILRVPAASIQATRAADGYDMAQGHEVEVAGAAAATGEPTAAEPFLTSAR